MQIAIYEKFIPGQGWQEEVGTEAFLDAGALTNLNAHDADVRAIRVTRALGASVYAEREARFGALQTAQSAGVYRAGKFTG